MLSLSADLSHTTVDLQLINGEEANAGGGVLYGNELMKFAEAIASGNPDDLSASRQALLSVASPEVLVDAAAVAGNFQRMVRIADSTGIPLDERNMGLSASVRSELDLERFGSAQNSRATTWLDKVKGRLMKPLFKHFVQRMARDLPAD
jgi:hypothetical protein